MKLRNKLLMILLAFIIIVALLSTLQSTQSTAIILPEDQHNKTLYDEFDAVIENFDSVNLFEIGGEEDIDKLNIATQNNDHIIVLSNRFTDNVKELADKNPLKYFYVLDSYGSSNNFGTIGTPLIELIPEVETEENEVVIDYVLFDSELNEESLSKVIEENNLSYINPIFIDHSLGDEEIIDFIKENLSEHSFAITKGIELEKYLVEAVKKTDTNIIIRTSGLGKNLENVALNLELDYAEEIRAIIKSIDKSERFQKIYDPSI